MICYGVTVFHDGEPGNATELINPGQGAEKSPRIFLKTTFSGICSPEPSRGKLGKTNFETKAERHVAWAGGWYLAQVFCVALFWMKFCNRSGPSGADQISERLSADHR